MGSDRGAALGRLCADCPPPVAPEVQGEIDELENADRVAVCGSGAAEAGGYCF